MRRLAVCLFLISFVSTGQAADVLSSDMKALTPHQNTALRGAIAYFLRPDDAPRSVYTLDNLHPHPAILELFVKELVSNIEKEGDRVRPKRLEQAVATLEALTLKMYDREVVRGRLADDLNRLLTLAVGQENLYRPLLGTFEHLGLVGHEQLAFFVSIRTKAQLTDAAPLLIEFLKKADDADRRAIAGMLRKLAKNKQERSLLNYAILSMTGFMTEKELVKFFKHASIKFARVLEDPSTDDIALAIDAMEARRHKIVRDEIRRFARALAKDDLTVRSAFTKAVEKARKEKCKGYECESRLSFFRLFKDNKVNWDNRANWRSRAAEIQDLSLPVYSKLANDLELAQFAIHHTCGDEI